jgi:hypothetical protein
MFKGVDGIGRQMTEVAMLRFDRERIPDSSPAASDYHEISISLPRHLETVHGIPRCLYPEQGADRWNRRQSIVIHT